MRSSICSRWNARFFSRVWREVVALGADLAKLDAVLGARVPAEVAILFDWESWWALEIDATPSVDVGQMDQLARYYAPLHDRNIAVDFVRPDGDLAGYKVVLAPNLYLARAGAAANLERFVARGGRLVMSFFSGIVDEQDHVLLGGYPAPFRARSWASASRSLSPTSPVRPTRLPF